MEGLRVSPLQKGQRGALPLGSLVSKGPLQIDLPPPPSFSYPVSASLGAGEENASVSKLCAPASHRCSLLINRQMLVLHLLSEGALSPGPCMSGH